MEESEATAGSRPPVGSRAMQDTGGRNGRVSESSSEGRQRWELRYARGDRDIFLSLTQGKPSHRFHADLISNSCLTLSFPGFCLSTSAVPRIPSKTVFRKPEASNLSKLPSMMPEALFKPRTWKIKEITIITYVLFLKGLPYDITLHPYIKYDWVISVLDIKFLELLQVFLQTEF